jgi:hypothetical protein
MARIYKLIKAEKVRNGIVHHVLDFGEERDYRYQSIRIGLVFPTMDNPAYFVVGGMEAEDPLEQNERGYIRIIEEMEISDLSFDTLFNSVTDSYSSMLCDEVYADLKTNDDYKLKYWSYLDRHNLRMNLSDVPYSDVVLRFSVLRDFNDSGSLGIDKGSALYADLQGISKEHLKDNPESKWYRLNALSFLISGFEKFKPTKPLNMGRTMGGNQSWML